MEVCGSEDASFFHKGNAEMNDYHDMTMWELEQERAKIDAELERRRPKAGDPCEPCGVCGAPMWWYVTHTCHGRTSSTDIVVDPK